VVHTVVDRLWRGVKGRDRRMEIACAPAMTFVSQPTAGDLMRLTMDRLLGC
jgi:hypothetical protein